MPASQIFGTPIVFDTISPNTIAHNTYSIFGSVRWCARPYAAIDCSVSLPAYPMRPSSATPGTSRSTCASGENVGRGGAATTTFMDAYQGTPVSTPSLTRTTAATAASTAHQSRERPTFGSYLLFGPRRG